MMYHKILQPIFRIFIASVFAIYAFAMPALSQGGSDPIPGIDIIIKKDPSSQPIKPFTPSNTQIRKLNTLKAEELLYYFSELIAAHVQDGGGKVTVKDIMAAFISRGCPPNPIYNCNDGKISFKTENAVTPFACM